MNWEKNKVGYKWDFLSTNRLSYHDASGWCCGVYKPRNGSSFTPLMLGEAAQGGHHLVQKATDQYEYYTKFHFPVIIIWFFFWSTPERISVRVNASSVFKILIHFLGVLFLVHEFFIFDFSIKTAPSIEPTRLSRPRMLHILAISTSCSRQLRSDGDEVKW